MAKKQALGKGLSALMGDHNAPASDNFQHDTARERTPSPATTREPGNDAPRDFDIIPISEIETNPYQPRTEFSHEELEELADSIRALGIIQPITLRRIGKRFEIISGERRLRAARMAGLETIPAYLRDVDDNEMRIMALVENLQRSDLNAIEVANSYQQIIDQCSISHDELSKRVGKSRTAITNQLRLLRLPSPVQNAIIAKEISMGHARALLGFDEPQMQLQALAIILEKGLSVRKTEELVRFMLEAQILEDEKQQQETEQAPKQSPHDDETLKTLQAKLGWGVSIASNEKGRGKITIAFRNDGEREELLKKLLSIES